MGIGYASTCFVSRMEYLFVTLAAAGGEYMFVNMKKITPCLSLDSFLDKIKYAMIKEPRQAKLCLRGMRGQRRPRSDCADAQSDLGLRCSLPESMDTTECINGEQRPG